MDTDGISRGPQPGVETVYGTEDNNMVMSEKNEQVVSIVQQLASSIYQEFERMINRYDEDVVKNLMPLLVNVLECLDASYRINQEQDVEVELLREDNEQLVTQYEREKSARKQTEQKLLEAEDVAETENKELASRLESLESIVRMLELKHKNSLEHASRLEEREGELKKEFNKLHDRYTELFKTHVDYMERTKMMMGSTHSHMSSASERIEINRGRLNPIIRSSGPVSYGFASLENSAMLDTETICSIGSNSDDSGPPSLQNELENVHTMERAAETDTLHHINQATSPQSDGSPIVPNAPSNVGRTTTKKEQRSANTLYQELSFQDNEESEETEMVTGSWVHPGEYASSGMGKEVENLIMENNELLATKNALNVVKDDLIVKVDELTVEIEVLREDLNAVSQSRNKLRQKVTELEEELKKTKELVKQQNDSEQEGDDVPMAQRKRFTRVEMAMVLRERNQYKERYMELQDAVRYAEIMRASNKTMEKSKAGIWKYFNSLFTSNARPQERDAGQGGGPIFRYNSPSHSYGSPSRNSDNRLAITALPGHVTTNVGLANALITAKDFTETGTSERATARRKEEYRQLRAHVPKEDGRKYAYGWSLPTNKSNQEHNNRHSGSVPVPVYCQPFAEANPHMKVFCAAGVTLSGGYNRDGDSVIGTNIFYSTPPAKITEITSPTTECNSHESLERKLNVSLNGEDPDTQLSSYVWVCTSTHAASTVTVLDANMAGNVLDAFPICQSHLLCIASVPGAMEKDYALLENSEIIKAGETLEKPGEGPEKIGNVEYVRVRPKSDQNRNTESKDANGIDTELASTQNSDDIEEKAQEALEKASSNENDDSTKSETTETTPTTPVHQFAPGVDLTNSNGVSATNTNNNNNNNTNAPLAFCRPVNPILGTQNRQNEPVMTSVGPTMWLGDQDGMLYVHSSVGRWHECLHKLRLPDAVLGIVYVELRVVVALANGQLAVFRRQTDGQWDLNSYHLLTLGDHQHSIRCLCVVADKIWAAHRNKIHIVDPIALDVVHTLEAHPRKESQVRQMTATGLGVWVSIRLDSNLRLYHAHTYEHIEDVDIEPYVSKMLGTGKLGFSFVRITALLVSCGRLWIGTSNGVIISVPLNEGTCKQNNTGLIPRCGMASAQLSFHGHRDAVKFFVSVPTSQRQDIPTDQFSNKRPDMLVISGGEGYIDFRHGQEKHAVDVCDNAAHLIVWRNITCSPLYNNLEQSPLRNKILKIVNAYDIEACRLFYYFSFIIICCYSGCYLFDNFCVLFF